MKTSMIILGMLFVSCCFYINSAAPGIEIKYKPHKYSEDDSDKEIMKVMKMNDDYDNDYVNNDEKDYLTIPPKTFRQ
ncbi:unnamed protein product [Gordionus sp. m RMFG-2023]